MPNFDTEEEFLAAELNSDLVLCDAVGDLWLAWEDDYGDWWAIRSRGEDDHPGPKGDEPRPVGPNRISSLRFPVAALDVHDAFADDEALGTDAPTNTEALEAALLDRLGLLEALGNSGVHTLAVELNQDGVRAPKAES